MGTLYVLLVDPDTLEGVAQDETNAAKNYAFSFGDVAQGNYRLYAGSDMNNDGYIDDECEAFGGYPVLSNTEVLDLTDDVSGLSFSASYVINMQKPTLLGQANGPVAGSSLHLKRLR